MPRSKQPLHGLPIALLALVLSGCGGGGSTNGGSTNPPTQPPTQNQTVTLTFISKNLDVNADAGQLYVHVGDAAITRATMLANGVNENAPTVRYQPGSSQLTTTLTVPKGKTVTIIAVEFSTNGFFSVPSGTPVPKSAPRDMVEFVGWEGNPAQPEAGVAVVTADADKTVTALFDRVQGLGVRAIGCSDIKLQSTNTAGLLSFGRIISDTLPDLTSTNAFTQTGRIQPEFDFSFVYGKQGSLFTLRARTREDRSPNVLRSGFIRWDGSASNCGSNLNCQVPVPSKANAPNALAMKMVSGYSFRENGYGCNCNPLTPNIPCQMLP